MDCSSCHGYLYGTSIIRPTPDEAIFCVDKSACRIQAASLCVEYLIQDRAHYAYIEKCVALARQYVVDSEEELEKYRYFWQEVFTLVDYHECRPIKGLKEYLDFLRNRLTKPEYPASPTYEITSPSYSPTSPLDVV
jgi:hypothetical protein